MSDKQDIDRDTVTGITADTAQDIDRDTVTGVRADTADIVTDSAPHTATDTREDTTPDTPREEPRYAAETTYTIERLIRYNNYHSLSKKWIWIILFVCTGFVALTLLMDIALWGFASELWLHTGLILAIDAVYLIFTFVVPRFVYKRAPSLNAVVRSEFYSDTFVTYAMTDKINERTESAYSAIVKVREGKRDIYLFISANQAHIISKDGISPADLDGFLAHLRARVGEKAFKK